MKSYVFIIVILLLTGINDVSAFAIDLKNLKKLNKALSVKSHIDKYNDSKKNISNLLWEEERTAIQEHYKCSIDAISSFDPSTLSITNRKKALNRLIKNINRHSKFYFEIQNKNAPIEYYNRAENITNQAATVLQSIVWSEHPVKSIESLNSLVLCFYIYKGTLREVAFESDLSDVELVSKSERNIGLLEVSGAHEDTILIAELLSGPNKKRRKRQLSTVKIIENIEAHNFIQGKPNRKFLMFSERVKDYKSSCECFKKNQAEDKLSYGVDNFCKKFDDIYSNEIYSEVVDIREKINQQNTGKELTIEPIKESDFKVLKLENKELYETLIETMTYSAQYRANSGLRCSLNQLLNNS